MNSLRLLLLVGLLLAACSRAEQTAVEDAVSPIQITRISGDTAVGTPRIVFGLFDAPDAVSDT